MHDFKNHIFLVIFIINARKGQFEDDESPAVRILFDDEVREGKEGSDTQKSEKGENNKLEEKSE